jgi:predicted phage terminase large subunit-like protein
MRLLTGHTVKSSVETGDKSTRAAPVISQVNGGNLAIVKAGWNRAFLDELAAFPAGVKDDQVDALSRAFSIVGLGARPLVVSADVLAVLGQR